MADTGKRARKRQIDKQASYIYNVKILIMKDLFLLYG